MKLIKFVKKTVDIIKLRKRGICIAQHVDYSNTQFGDYVNLAHHSQISNSKIGLRTSVGRYTKIQYAIIGKYCSISWDVTIGALEHPIHAISTHAFSYRKQFGLCNEDKMIEHRNVKIGNDVWIGCGAIIMPGIHIGNGAIIGAGSVVTHDVASYEIVAGCPAKHISWRFKENIICKLEEIGWWDFSDKKIKENLHLFTSENDLSSSTVLLDELLKLKGENDL